MAWNQDGEPPARQDTPIAGDECGARREPPEQCMQVPISGSHGVQAGEGNTQVNNYFISGQSPGWRALALGSAFAVTITIALGFALTTNNNADSQDAASGTATGSQSSQPQPGAPVPEGSAAPPATEFAVCISPALTCRGSTATNLQTEPSVIVNSVDEAAYIRDLKWAGWGTAVATGTGTLVGDNCDPDCVYGHDTSYEATVVLTRLASFGNGRQAYSSMVIKVPDAPSRSETFNTLLVP
jgi:hypothetical protein